MAQIPVAVVGATGVAGQQFLVALAAHPWFHVKVVAASERSAGRPLVEALRGPSGESRWHVSEPLDERLGLLVVQDAAAFDPVREGVRLVFSAMESGPAREHEPRYAAHVPVISTASAFRYEDDVPILIPGVNPDHVALLTSQMKRRNWAGFVAPNPNCTTVGLAVTLAPLYRQFGIKRVIMTSMQAVSGAGRSPGVPALDMFDNLIPYISGEEEKVAKETGKILGAVSGETISAAKFPVSATCTRVAVLEGHTETVAVELEKPATADQVQAAWAAFGQELAAKSYPSAPKRMIAYTTDPYRPQPRLDRDTDNGMVTTVGRLRPDAALGSDGHGWKYVLLSHNTKMGAARGCVLMAETLFKEGLVK